MHSWPMAFQYKTSHFIFPEVMENVGLPVAKYHGSGPSG